MYVLDLAAQVRLTIAICDVDFFLSVSALGRNNQVKWGGKYVLSISKLNRILFLTGKRSLSSNVLFLGKLFG